MVRNFVLCSQGPTLLCVFIVSRVKEMTEDCWRWLNLTKICEIHPPFALTWVTHWGTGVAHLIQHIIDTFCVTNILHMIIIVRLGKGRITMALTPQSLSTLVDMDSLRGDLPSSGMHIWVELLLLRIYITFHLAVVSPRSVQSASRLASSHLVSVFVGGMIINLL